MHSIRHWNFRYLVNRFKEKVYRSQHPDIPWLTPESVNFLETYLRPTDKGLEYGSGGSTIWLARRVRELTSVEHNLKWYSTINEKLQRIETNNVSFHYFPKVMDDPSGKNSDYVQVVKTIPAASLNFVLIDGIYRAQCVLQSIPLLVPGGILVIDNVNKYLPSNSYAPNSRSFAERPIDEEWQQVLEILQHWRNYWTGNGVSDTAIYFKPMK
ncbi:MAG: hypothetical protein AB9897_07460 [Anaerolineaceae bacterium]